MHGAKIKICRASFQNKINFIHWYIFFSFAIGMTEMCLQQRLSTFYAGIPLSAVQLFQCTATSLI